MKTIEETVKHFKMIKQISYSMYTDAVNQFINIIEGNDTENIQQTFYPGKDIEFFKAVLRQLGEEY
jgi:hypothetical protein